MLNMRSSCKLRVIFLLICAISVYGNTVNVSVYYETLCPACKVFITRQLYPTYKYLGENQMVLDLVPFGWASVKVNNGKYEISCQHGERECYGNRLHACALSSYPIQKSLMFVNCTLSYNDPVSNDVFEWCAKTSNISADYLQLCQKDRGYHLLVENSRKSNFTHKYIPAVVLNGKFDETMRNEITGNFYKVVNEYLNLNISWKELATTQNSIRENTTEKRFHKNGSSMDGVKVSVYYEALCGDSIRFIAQQLHPNYPKLAQHIELDLIPYGKAVYAKRNGTYHFSCQHGPAECKGNLYQSCALSQNNGGLKDIEFVNCIMRRHPDHFSSVEKCASKYDLDSSKIKNCSLTEEGNELLAHNGNRTLELEPTLSFVPTVVYNDVYDDEAQWQSLTDFAAVVCSKIEGDKPTICQNSRLPKSIWGQFEIF